MGDVDVAIWLASGYAAFLLLAAFGLDLGARHAASRTTAWRAGAFRYHEQHDAWVCSEDQWLWPMSFDPDSRVMRYRASASVCNACPNRCTTSQSGREVIRNVDPWPSSEVERFHRMIACSVAALGIIWPLVTMIGSRTPAELVILAAVAVGVGAGSWPLWSHLHRTPAGFPEHVRVETLDETLAAQAAAAIASGGGAGYRSDRRAPERGPVSVTIGTRRAPAASPEAIATAAERSAFASRWSAFERQELKLRADDDTAPAGGAETTSSYRTERT